MSFIYIIISLIIGVIIGKFGFSKSEVEKITPASFKVDNKNHEFGSALFYIAYYLLDKNNEEKVAMFTLKELQRAFKRGEKNKDEF